MAEAFEGKPMSRIVFVILILVAALVMGMVLVIILSVIPTFTDTNTVAAVGEQYCIRDLRIAIRFNNSNLNGTARRIATSYALSLACTNLLNNYYTDSQLSSCLISNCSLGRNIFAQNNIVIRDNLICESAVIYYSVRCPDQGVLSGLYNYVTSSDNSYCRRTRMTRINAALGRSSTIQYPNVRTIISDNTAIYVDSLFSEMFSNYSQPGAQYCGVINRTSIVNAISAQSSG